MSARARVSVIVPTYRRPDYLGVCLRSLQAQTFRDFHVLVCDNGADPDSEDVVRALEDDRFSYVARTTNVGILGNVIAGFRDTRSPLVMELDDDDYLAPQCLERLVSPFDGRPGLALTFADLEVIDARGAVVSPETREGTVQPERHLRQGFYEDFTLLAARGFIFTVAAVLNRDAVDWATIPAEATTSYDRYLTVTAARRGGGAYYVDERLAFYRVHPDMDSTRRQEEQLDGAMFVLMNALRTAGPVEARILRDEITNLHLERVRLYVRQHRWWGAARALGSAISSWPGTLYTFTTLGRRCLRLRARAR